MRSLVDRSTSETVALLANLNTALADVHVLGLPSPRSAVTLNNTLSLTTAWDTATKVKACCEAHYTIFEMYYNNIIFIIGTKADLSIELATYH